MFFCVVCLLLALEGFALKTLSLLKLICYHSVTTLLSLCRRGTAWEEEMPLTDITLFIPTASLQKKTSKLWRTDIIIICMYILLLQSCYFFNIHIQEMCDLHSKWWEISTPSVLTLPVTSMEAHFHLRVRIKPIVRKFKLRNSHIVKHKININNTY